jgi:hypothetical protein
MSPSAGRRPPTLRDGVVLGLFVIGLLGSVVVPLTDGDGVPDVQLWSSTIKGLRPTLKPGTTVLIQPPWRDDVLDHLDALAAEGKPVLPGGVTATVALARAHDSWPGRVVLVADPALPLPASLTRRVEALTSDKRHENNGLLVAVLESDEPEVAPSTAASLDSLLPRASVSVSTGSKVTHCRYDPKKRRHLCPGEPEWIWVGAYSMSSGGQSKSCLWAHPPANGGTLAITFPQVTLQGALEVQHALTDGAVRNGGSPVDVRVLVGGREVGRSRRTNAVTFARRAFGTQAGEIADITLEVSARHDGARHHCLTARLLEEMP